MNMVVLGLSGYERDVERLDRAVGYFQRRGYVVKVEPGADQHDLRFAATDAQRLAALNRAVADPDVDLMMALRGGYGVTPLLDAIDFASISRAVAQRGVRIVGHSDFTALGLALLAYDGTSSYAGPMASFDFGAEVPDAFMEQHFWSAVQEPNSELQWESENPRCEREGVLWGGNLAMLCSLLGTRHLPEVEGGILFVEDINEQPYRIERMLMQLLQAGVLGRQSAIVCGDFSGYRITDYDGDYSLRVALERVSDHLDIPLLQGLPFGHIARKVTLQLGAHAQLKSDGAVCRLHVDSHRTR